MRTAVSTIIIIAAAFLGFFLGTGMNEAMAGAILFATIVGFACTIAAIESKKTGTFIKLLFLIKRSRISEI